MTPELMRFAPYALATRPILPSALRRQNDTEYNALVRTHLSRSADVSATIGRDHVIDLVVGNRRPNTVHFNFVVIANDATLGRPTINQIAARTSVVSSELRVEALIQFIVARPVVSLLRRSVHTKKQGSRAAEQDDELAPLQLIELHSIPASEGRRGRISNWRRAVSGYRNGFTTYNSRRGSRRMWKMDEFLKLGKFEKIRVGFR